MFKLFILLSILGTLIRAPMQIRALMIPFFVFPVKMSYDIIENNIHLGTPQEEFENYKTQMLTEFDNHQRISIEQLSNQEEEFNKMKLEFLEEFDKRTKDQLAWLEEEKSVYQKEYEEKYAELNNELERLATDWEAQNEELIKFHQQAIEDLHTQYAMEIEMRDKQIHFLQMRLDEHEKLPTWCPPAFGKVADEINSLIQELVTLTDSEAARFKSASTNYVCDYVTHSLKDDGILRVWLKPKEIEYTDKIIRLDNQLTVFNYAHVAIKPDRGALKFELRNEMYEELLTEDLKVLEDQLEHPDPKIVKIVFTKFIHAFVWGNTGTGKSTLIQNLVDLIDYLKIQDGQESDPSFAKLYDPKFPHSQVGEDNFLSLDGIPVSWSRWESLYNCSIDLLYEIDHRLERHYDEVIEQLENDKREALSNLLTQTYIMDELELAIADCKLTLAEAYEEGLLGVEQVTKFNLLQNRPGLSYGDLTPSQVVAKVLKLARSSKVRLIGVGQSPMPAHYQLLKIDFLNCTRIWLGDVAETVMLGRGNEFLQIPAKDKTKLRKQVELRKQINMIRLREGKDLIRYMVVHSPGLPVFIMDCPKPHSLVTDLFGIPHRFQGRSNRIPLDAKGSATASQLNVKPDAVEVPKHSDRDSLRNQLESLYNAPDLTENQEKLRAYLSKHKGVGFTVPKLRDRLSWLKSIDDQQLRVDLTALQNASYIKITDRKIWYEEA
ncbi:MAG: hypothetical protein HC878_00100 [Leptolyngbyaceae cyanobacterium SL_5_14]|nr:hypothetical protein [Leptolyngbyaceae cyanobacterium SL_5_14]